MRHCLGVGVLWAVGLAGCQPGGLATDPFLRTRVPPEGTGLPSGGPYYPGATLGPNITPPATTVPATTPNPTPAPAAAPTSPGSNLTPPGGSFNVQPSSSLVPRPAPDESKSPTPATADSSSSGSTLRLAEAVDEESGTSGDTSTSDEPSVVTRREPEANSTVRVAFLDPADAEPPATEEPTESDNAAADTTGPAADVVVLGEKPPSSGRSTLRILPGPAAGHRDRPQPTSSSPWRSSGAGLPASAPRGGESPFRETRSENAASDGASLGPFAHDPNYHWLRGRLEHSAASGKWKLRYIPIDGQTDSYGGSVVLDGAELLEGHRAGETVTVFGRLAAPESGRGFAPTYQIEAVEP
jgi:hypothetical protein